MIDHTTFGREMALLSDRFNRQVSKPVMARYYETLSATLTTEQFETAARVVFDQDTFWPSPARFLEAAGRDRKSEAEAAWELTMSEVRSGRAKPLSEYDPAHAYALKAVGKNVRLARVPTPEKLDFVKHDFVAAFTSYRERGGLPELDRPEPVELAGVWK